MNDFRQVEWDAEVEDDCRQLVRLAVREDLERLYDWTSVALVPEAAAGKARVVARKPGVIAGLPAARVTLDEYDPRLEWRALIDDGQPVGSATAVAEIEGNARSLLAVERPLLNLLGHLSGIATLTRRFVDAVAGTSARIYDTRKTTPGWRRLEKYAVRLGGGHNHRLGLFDGILIKDNHLALGAAAEGPHFSPADAVRKARELLARLDESDAHRRMLVEIEVDSLDQLREVLPLGPNIVLLDNMPPSTLRAAVELRNSLAPAVELEASGGIHLQTVADVARSGVERISVGALTHSAEWLDVGLDWLARRPL
ncbi:MAG: nicotinate-nucleotide diphosphorylase (carboxylating) [Planctomycetia bacterium 21-64-5]|nr:MAG: nicotinate-nucleotide diphosphorylase (carboxylating) [Planctomycetia bacterium 21-64-5]HQU41228.1 carboxylating nicotinate-nucleotide diphosphorylase [Pirellulales bacterium]